MMCVCLLLLLFPIVACVLFRCVLRVCVCVVGLCVWLLCVCLFCLFSCACVLFVWLSIVLFVFVVFVWLSCALRCVFVLIGLFLVEYVFSCCL